MISWAIAGLLVITASRWREVKSDLLGTQFVLTPAGAGECPRPGVHAKAVIIGVRSAIECAAQCRRRTSGKSPCVEFNFSHHAEQKSCTLFSRLQPRKLLVPTPRCRHMKIKATTSISTFSSTTAEDRTSFPYVDMTSTTRTTAESTPATAAAPPSGGNGGGGRKGNGGKKKGKGPPGQPPPDLTNEATIR